ncbi:ion transporter [Nocardioides sp.]|uniref:ion transporter n=1 Tax=Nocardioides sp. TaxID=35761 RepID=UPI0026245D94|nr:ion transporter [Nocardioides sp.]
MTPVKPAGSPGPIERFVDHANDAAEAAARRADELFLTISGRRRTLTDAFLVGLTWVAFGLSIWMLFLQPRTDALHDTVRYVDWVVAAVIAAAICWRWLRFRIGWRYLRKHWWEVPALVPVAIPLVTDHRLVLWAIVIFRFVRAADRLDNYYGDKVTAAVIGHFLDPIVDTIKRPITVAVLDEVIDVIQQGDYATNVRAALDENRDEIEAMVLELIRNDPTTGKLKYVPFHTEIVNLTSDTVLRIVEGALADPRTTELISDIIRNSATQLRTAIREDH